MKKLLATALLFGITFAPFTRAEDPKKPAAPAAAKPAPQKEDPSAPKPKGNDEKSKASYIARHEGFMKDKEAALKNGPIQFVALGDSITDGWRGTPKADDPNHRGGKLVWDKTFGPYNPYNTGIGGDR